MSYFEFPHTRTYDSDLGWLIKNAKDLNSAVAALEEWRNEVNPTVEDLENLLRQLEQGIVPENIAEGIRAWIAANFYDIIAEMIKALYFGLTDNGYFVAWIPETWDDVVFNTTGHDIMVDICPEYGHLVLSAKTGGH